MKLLSLSYCAFLSLSLLSFHYQQAMTPDDAKNEEIIIKKAETEHKAAVLEEKREREAALKKKAKQFIWLQWLDLDKKVGEKPALHKVNGFTDTIDLSEREIMCCAVHASKEIRKKLPELNRKDIENFRFRVIEQKEDHYIYIFKNGSSEDFFVAEYILDRSADPAMFKLTTDEIIEFSL